MSRHDPTRHPRRSIRSKGYDYTQPGAYFIPICTYERASLLGSVVKGKMRLNAWGEIVREEGFKTAQIRPYVRLQDNQFVVMPNHVHGIIWIVDNAAGENAHEGAVGVGARRRCAPIERFGATVWGRNYDEPLIRHERALDAMRQYPRENPLHWHMDKHNPKSIAEDPLAREMRTHLTER